MRIINLQIFLNFLDILDEFLDQLKNSNMESLKIEIKLQIINKKILV